MTKTEIEALLDVARFPEYTFRVIEEAGRCYLQAYYNDKDIVTGAVELQYTRKWVISPHAVKSEIVQTAFKCIVTSFEHRAREHFKYRGKAVFGPHFDVDALWRVCTDREHDYRGKQ